MLSSFVIDEIMLFIKHFSLFLVIRVAVVSRLCRDQIYCGLTDTLNAHNYAKLSFNFEQLLLQKCTAMLDYKSVSLGKCTKWD
jgi:hypothetical protein